MPAPAELRPTNADLQRLYLDEKMTARQIGAQCNVRHITVLRWLKAAGVERRAVSRGLANRGIVAPTSDELQQMVHVDHLSYEEIAAKYGVDFTAVPNWLDKHGIERPTAWGTRRRGVEPPALDAGDVVARYSSGQSMQNIADTHGATRGAVKAVLLENGCPMRMDGWRAGWRYECSDGHQARSLYEQRVDDWLSSHGLPHEIEPAYPWDRRYRADFLVNGTYIEVWGVTDNDAYTARKAMKIERCRDAGLALIQINHWQFATGRRWWAPLRQLL